MKGFLKLLLIPTIILLFGVTVTALAGPETAESLKTPAQQLSPLTLSQVNYPVQPGTPEEMARQYLRANAAALGLNDPALGDLVHRFTRQSLSGTTVRFTQTVGGIPVYQGEVIVHINNQTVVTLVSSQYQAQAALASLVPTLTAEAAAQAAHQHLNAQGPLRYNKTQLMVYLDATGARLVYQVRVIPTAPLGDWELLVDAHSGAILKLSNLAYHLDDAEGAGEGQTAVLVDGTGLVFNPDPLSSSGAAYGDPGFSDGSDATTPEMDAERVSVTLLDIQFSGGMHTLIGPYAEIQDFEAPNYGLFSQVSSDFSYNRFDNNFEAVMTYYHIDGSMRYINTTLGIPLMPFQYSGGVRFDPHGLSGADNSHYLPGTGQVSFGEGGVDDDEDADVIWHELGHGLHDWLTGGSLSQVNGLSEGFGDYWAQSHSRALNQWTPADPEYDWVFNWDGHNPFWPGRVTNYSGHYPEDLTGQIHTDGQIWSTCLMTIWDDIGREATDTAVLEGLAMTNSSTNQEQAANAVYQAALDMGYTYAQLLAINTNFAACGYTMPELPPANDFTLDVTPASLDICAPADAVYAVTLTPTGSFTQTVTLDVQGEPAGTTAVFNIPSGVPPFSSTLTIGNTGAGTAGSYNMDVIGTAVTRTHTATVQLNLYSAAPSAPILLTPPNGASNIPVEPTFTWTAVSNVSGYFLEVATDAAFATVVYSAIEPTTSHTIPSGSGLDFNTTYYWRVAAQNGCGSTPSTTFNFSTGDTPAEFCATPGLPIPDVGTTSTTLNYPEDGTILDLNLYIGAAHTWVGDLTFTLSNGATSVTVVDRPGQSGTGFGCSGDNIDATLDDEGPDGPVENQCANNPALFGSPTPNNALSAFDGESINGTWTLTIQDSASGDTGTLNEWCLIPSVSVPYGVLLSPDTSETGLPGETVTHTVQITNTGSTTDTFDLAVSGETWATALPSSVTLAGGANTTVEVAVEIPISALGNEGDTAVLTATSQGDPNESDTAQLTTTAQALYAVELSADMNDSGMPDEIVMYTVQITNTGNTTDTFDLSAAATWTTTLEFPDVTLGANENTTIIVYVHIPASAVHGEMDVAAITAVSQNDNTATATTTLTTTASTGYTLYLPIILREN